MLCLGLFVFTLDTLSYQELQRRSSWKHASQPLVGARNASQYLGPGDDIITLNGIVVPEFAGAPASLSVLRLMADQGAAWVLVEGTGTIYGAFVITELQERKTGRIPVKSTDRDLDSRFPCPSSPLPPPPLSARRK